MTIILIFTTEKSTKDFYSSSSILKIYLSYTLRILVLKDKHRGY